MDDLERSHERRENALPEHELDDPDTTGAGMLSSGGTATERGTDTLDGQAQGPEHDDDRDEQLSGELTGRIGMAPGTPAGGAQTYVAPALDDDERGGVPDA
jgi:hypothetical protein